MRHPRLARTPFGAVGCRAAAMAVAFLLGAGGVVVAQEPASGQPPSPAPAAARAPIAQGGEARAVTGVVARATDVDLIASASVWATLHRVGRDQAGPVDSVRTDARGGYRLPYRVSPADSTSVFFVSAEFGGVTYFTPPAGPDLFGPTADTIVVFDTTSGPLSLAMRGRHLIVGAPDSTDRIIVVEVFELANDTEKTLVATAEERATWAVPLPAGAQDVRAGQSDVSEEAMAARGGRLEVYAPFAPGLKQISFSYTLSRDDFPLRVPIEQPVDVLEVLVEDQGAQVAGPGLEEVEPATLEGRTFRRLLADEAPAGGVVTVSLAAVAFDNRSLYVAAVLLAVGMVMLLALARSFQRRTASARAVGVPVEETPDRLAQRIVELDSRFQRRRAPTDAERAAYEQERQELKGRLTDALLDRDARL